VRGSNHDCCERGERSSTVGIVCFAGWGFHINSKHLFEMPAPQTLSMTSPKAQLGCGTFALIALIVMFFSRGNESSREMRELKSEVAALRNDVQELRRTIELQNKQPVGLLQKPKPEQEPVPQ
jgi:fructoselysine-6-P-deglycase FrlB-like protein